MDLNWTSAEGGIHASPNVSAGSLSASTLVFQRQGSLCQFRADERVDDRLRERLIEGTMMNKDTIKGKTNAVVGETRKRTGRAVGDDSIEAKGQAQESKGKTQSAVGNLKDKAGHMKDEVKSAVKG
jgi:uncharacterized protein YjbJ (UPF0337 family)